MRSARQLLLTSYTCAFVLHIAHMEENVFDGIDNVEQSFGPMSNAEVFSAKPFLEVTPGVTEILMFSVDLSKTPARYDCRNTMALKMDDGQTKINLIFKKDTVYASVEDGDSNSWQNLSIRSIPLPVLSFELHVKHDRMALYFETIEHPIKVRNGFKGQIRITMHALRRCINMDVRIERAKQHDRVTELRQTGDISVPIFRMALIILLPIAIVATVPTAALMWLEAIEKRRYQLAKDKPIKLKLTREYLAKVRPPKKRQVTKPQADAQEHK